MTSIDTGGLVGEHPNILGGSPYTISSSHGSLVGCGLAVPYAGGPAVTDQPVPSSKSYSYYRVRNPLFSFTPVLGFIGSPSPILWI